MLDSAPFTHYIPSYAACMPWGSAVLEPFPLRHGYRVAAEPPNPGINPALIWELRYPAPRLDDDEPSDSPPPTRASSPVGTSPGSLSPDASTSSDTESIQTPFPGDALRGAAIQVSGGGKTKRKRDPSPDTSRKTTAAPSTRSTCPNGTHTGRTSRRTAGRPARNLPPEEGYMCPYPHPTDPHKRCSLFFDRLKDVQRHVRNHMVNEHNRFEQSGQTIPRSSLVFYGAEAGRSICPDCGRAVSRSDALIRHMRLGCKKTPIEGTGEGGEVGEDWLDAPRWVAIDRQAPWAAHGHPRPCKVSAVVKKTKVGAQMKKTVQRVVSVMSSYSDKYQLVGKKGDKDTEVQFFIEGDGRTGGTKVYTQPKD